MKTVMLFTRPFPSCRYLLLVFGLLATSCTLRDTRQEAPNLEPRFRVKNVETASLGTLDVIRLREPSDVDLPRRNQLIKGYVNHKLPLKITLQLSVFNPGLEPAVVNGFAYTVLIDGKELGSSRSPDPIQLPASDSVLVPLSFEMETYKLLGNDALPALRNFALGFGDQRRKRVTLRIRPQLRSPRGRLSTLIHPKVLASATIFAQDTEFPLSQR